jgi:hypothetical protein
VVRERELAERERDPPALAREDEDLAVDLPRAAGFDFARDAGLALLAADFVVRLAFDRVVEAFALADFLAPVAFALVLPAAFDAPVVALDALDLALVVAARARLPAVFELAPVVVARTALVSASARLPAAFTARFAVLPADLAAFFAAVAVCLADCFRSDSDFLAAERLRVAAAFLAAALRCAFVWAMLKLLFLGWWDAEANRCGGGCGA